VSVVELALPHVHDRADIGTDDRADDHPLDHDNGPSYYAVVHRDDGTDIWYCVL
jgi:hypothetical protein